MIDNLWCWLGALVGGIAAVFVGLCFLINAMERERCLTRYADFQPEYHGFVTGCLVQYNGKTVPASSLRVMD